MNTQSNSDALPPMAGSTSSDTPETDAATHLMQHAPNQWLAVVDAEFAEKLERQRDAAVMLAGELVAIIRVNAMRGTWAEATPEQVDEFLVPWIAKLRVAQGHSPDNDQIHP